MWPFYVLPNKILRAEEEKGQQSDRDHFMGVEAYPFEQALSNEKCYNGVLPRSLFVEVRPFDSSRRFLFHKKFSICKRLFALTH